MCIKIIFNEEYVYKRGKYSREPKEATTLAMLRFTVINSQKSVDEVPSDIQGSGSTPDIITHHPNKLAAQEINPAP